MPSILVRVDIINEFNKKKFVLTFNPCSCGYYVWVINMIFPSTLQSLFVWILWVFSIKFGVWYASILVRVDIILKKQKNYRTKPFNPCSCGYYGMIDKIPIGHGLQSLFVWILCKNAEQKARVYASILVRVDIMNIIMVCTDAIIFNPCSCGYYVIILVLSVIVILQSLFVWILFHNP